MQAYKCTDYVISINIRLRNYIKHSIRQQKAHMVKILVNTEHAPLLPHPRAFYYSNPDGDFKT